MRSVINYSFVSLFNKCVILISGLMMSACPWLGYLGSSDQVACTLFMFADLNIGFFELDGDRLKTHTQYMLRLYQMPLVLELVPVTTVILTVLIYTPLNNNNQYWAASSCLCICLLQCGSFSQSLCWFINQTM